MKKTLAITLAVIMVFTMGMTCASFADDASYPNAKVDVNGQAVAWTDMQPVNISGMVFVPIRETLEAFGQEVVWNNADKTVTTTDKITGMTALIDLGSTVVATTQNDVKREFEMAAAPRLINGKTMVSIRALTDIYGKVVSYDKATATVQVKDYTEDVAGVIALDKEKTTDAYIGDVVRIHYSTDGTYDYNFLKNDDFMYLSKAAEGVGNYCMFFKAMNEKADASVVINKYITTTDAAATLAETYKVKVADPCDKAVTPTIENVTKVNNGGYVKVELTCNAGSTGYEWYVTSLPANLQMVERFHTAPTQVPGKEAMVGVPTTETFVFKAVAAGSAKLQFDAMRGWGNESAETVAFDIEVK